MVTYWFVIGWFDNQSAQKSKVRQAAKDDKVIKTVEEMKWAGVKILRDKE